MSANSISEIIKFNGGNLAIVCMDCGKILFTGKDFDLCERAYLYGEDLLTKSLVKTILDLRVIDRYDRYLCSECKNKKQNE